MPATHTLPVAMARTQYEARIALMAPPAEITTVREQTIDGPGGPLRIRKSAAPGWPIPTSSWCPPRLELEHAVGHANDASIFNNLNPNSTAIRSGFLGRRRMGLVTLWSVVARYRRRLPVQITS